MSEIDVGNVTKKVFDTLLGELGMSRTPFEGDVAVARMSDKKLNVMLNVLSLVVAILIANIMAREGVDRGATVFAEFSHAIAVRSKESLADIEKMKAVAL